MLLFSAEEHLRLRKQRRLVGTEIGTLPTNPQQNSQLGPPFYFFDGAASETATVEPKFATEQSSQNGAASDPKFATVEGSKKATSILEALRDRVYADLVAAKFFVRSAVASHGVDFVCYPSDPVAAHAYLLVKCVVDKRSIAPRDLLAWTRVAQGVKKDVYLASFSPDEDVESAATASGSRFVGATEESAATASGSGFVGATEESAATASGSRFVCEPEASRRVEEAEVLAEKSGDLHTYGLRISYRKLEILGNYL
ncbi:unnamed protein product [Amoebophrya sp. A25]|nr:unnamed protein product [Amoebophrya sp. A25]|eukprot:GSA25T00026888001.1